MLINIDNMQKYEVVSLNTKTLTIVNKTNHLYCLTCYDPGFPYVEPGGFKNLVPGYYPGDFSWEDAFTFRCSEFWFHNLDKVWQVSKIAFVASPTGKLYVTKWK